MAQDSKKPVLLDHSVSRQPPHAAQVDCPNCKGLGTVTVLRARDAALTYISSVCSDCDWTPTAAQTEPSAQPEISEYLEAEAEEAEEYPQHAGAGWFVLSNGNKLRGRDEALAAQGTLDGT